MHRTRAAGGVYPGRSHGKIAPAPILEWRTDELGDHMPSPLEVHDWHELDVDSKDGEHVGKLVDVYVTKDTGEPEFLLVSSGLLGHHLHLVPAEGATRSDERVQVAADKATIESAPTVRADDDLDAEEEQRLFEHYGRDYTPHPEGILILRRFVLIERR